MAGREPPRHGAAPVVADHVEPLKLGPVGEGDDVADELVERVVPPARWPGRGGVAALVGSEHPVARVDEGRRDGMPGLLRLGEAVPQDHAVPVAATVVHIEAEPVVLDREEADHAADAPALAGPRDRSLGPVWVGWGAVPPQDTPTAPQPTP